MTSAPEFLLSHGQQSSLSRTVHVLVFIAGKMSERKAVIKNADMSDEMQQDAVEVCCRVDAIA